MYLFLLNGHLIQSSARGQGGKRNAESGQDDLIRHGATLVLYDICICAGQWFEQQSVPKQQEPNLCQALVLLATQIIVCPARFQKISASLFHAKLCRI